MNELKKVLSLIEAFRAANKSRRDFARSRGLHPSALSRILRVGELPGELLDELASFERLSRTHLEVIATAPSERRPELLARVREGRSTYSLRERRETTAVAIAAPEAAKSTAPERSGYPTPSAERSGYPTASPAPERVPSPAPSVPPPSMYEDPRARELARRLGATPEETHAFALELLAALLRGSPDRVRSSLAQFRATARPRDRARP